MLEAILQDDPRKIVLVITVLNNTLLPDRYQAIIQTKSELREISLYSVDTASDSFVTILWRKKIQDVKGSNTASVTLCWWLSARLQ